MATLVSPDLAAAHQYDEPQNGSLLITVDTNPSGTPVILTEPLITSPSLSSGGATTSAHPIG